MKKFLTFVAILAGVLALTFLSVDKAEAAVDNVNNLNGIFEKYYNEGVYTKETKIYLSESAQTDILNYKDLFHAGATSLERTTYYSGDALWMSRGKEAEGVKYSYYGTAYEAGLPVGVTNATADIALVAPEDAKVVLSGEGKESMEAYYVTMNDMVATEAQAWSVEGNVYKSSDLDLIDAFRNFTAPCFLALNENTKDFFQWSHVTLEEKAGKLYLSLYMDETSEGYVTGENYLFSQAVVYFEGSEVVEPIIPVYSYVINEGGIDASSVVFVDNQDGTAELRFTTKTRWGEFQIFADGVQLTSDNSNFTGLYRVNPWFDDLANYVYPETGSSLGGPCLVAFDYDGLDIPHTYMVTITAGEKYTVEFTLHKEANEVSIPKLNADCGGDNWSVFTNAGTKIKTGVDSTDAATIQSSYVGRGWRTYIVVDKEGRIAYFTQNPVNGYGGYGGNSYYRNSYYDQAGVVNPSFNVLEGWEAWKQGSGKHNLYDLVVPEGGFVIIAHGTGATAIYDLLGVPADQRADNQIKPGLLSDSVRITYNSSNNTLAISK